MRRALWLLLLLIVVVAALALRIACSFENLPVWPLVQALGAGRPMGQRVALVETPSEAVELLA